MSSSFNIEEILTCLKNTYSSPNNNIRTSSEKKLSELKVDNIVVFTSNFIDLLSSKQLDQNLRMSIILLLKRIIKEKDDNNELDIDSNNQLIQLYITILVNPNISFKEIENLKETFILLVNNTTGEVLLEIINYINKQKSSMPLGSVNGVIEVLSAITNADQIKNKKIITMILEGVISMTCSIVENIYCKYENLSIEQNKDDYLKFNVIFYNIFDLFFQCSIRSYKKYKIKNDNISNLLDKVLIVGVKILVNMKAKDNNKIISWTGDKKTDKTINNMKINILKYVNLQVTIYGDIIIDQNKIENHQQIIKIFICNLEWLIMNKYTYLIKLESGDNYPDYSYSYVISYMFIYLKRIFNKDNYTKEFTNYFNSMYKNILLPLLMITDIEEEIALDNDSVNGFLIDMNDIVYENKQKKIKSAVAGLIKKIYEKNTKSNTFMINYTVKLLEYLILNNPNLDDKTLFDPNDIIILLLKAYPKEKIFHILFLALNIFSDVNDYPNKQTNDSILRKFFQNSFDNITKIEYPIIKHQIILFISNYSLRFYEPDVIAFETMIKYLYEYLFQMNYLLISNSAADAIQSFFTGKKKENESNVKYTLLKVATNISSNFEKMIIEAQISTFFDVLYQIMANFEKRDNDFFKNIFINLCKRINVEIERHLRLKFKVKKEKNKAKKKAVNQTNLSNYKVIINKCFNIIKMLLKDKRFIEKNFELIENSLKPLVEFMEEPKKIEFDEEIINAIYMLIIQREKVTGLCFSLIKNLYKYIDKCGGLLQDTYQLINAYLAYGTDQILANKNWYNGIFNAFNSGLQSKNFDKSSLYTCILLQTWVINSGKICKDNLATIIEIIVNKINDIIANYQNNKDIEKSKYSFLGCVTFILTGLINYSNEVINVLQKTKNGDSLKDWLKIIVDKNEINFEYEIKIIIYSICMNIEKGIITNQIHDLLNVCVDLLKCQEKNGNYELKKKTKKMLDFHFINEDDDDEDNSSKNESEEDDVDAEFKEIKKMVEKTINPIKNIDEFKVFLDLLKYMNNNKRNEYNLWLNSLNEERRLDVNKLMETKRINIQFNKGENILVPRRILSIKRNVSSNIK